MTGLNILMPEIVIDEEDLVTHAEYFALARARGVAFRIRTAEERRLAEEAQKRAARFAAQEAQDKDPGTAKRDARRKPRPAVAIKKIEKGTGKTVVGATFAADGSVTGVTFARFDEAAAETNPFEIEAARLRALKRGSK